MKIVRMQLNRPVMRRFAALSLALGLVLSAPSALAITFTSDTLMDDGDVTYDGQDIIVDGCTVTINGAHLFSSLSIVNSGVVTHTAGQSGFHLTIAGDLTVDAGGSISADGRGFAGDSGPGSGTPASAGSSSNGAGGGGYGGSGATGRNGFAGGIPYGSITAPIDLGSGGGGYALYVDDGGWGGGSLRLTVDGTCTLEGMVTATGTAGDETGGGGGSGGSIYLTVGTFTGTGSITANGGSGGSNAGGGGGGRIAIYYDVDTFTGSTTACGGSGYRRGGAGTIYTHASSEPDGHLLVDNCGGSGALTPLTDADTFADITASNQGKPEFVGSTVPTVVEQLIAADGGAFYVHTTATFPQAHVQPGGTITHNAGQSGFDLTITGDLTVDAGGSISADGKGSGSSAGPGQGGDNYSYGAGAGYGGAGGDSYNDSAAGGSAYGSITQPVDLGSGGGHATGYALGGAGGGAIRLTVDGTFTLEGALSANGATGQGTSSPGGGGGSGGSIYLTVSTLSGAGSIAANGGNSGGSYNYGGGGGGGRVAIYYDADTFTGSAAVCGGSGYLRGGAGTIYTKSSTQTYGDLLVDNCGNNGVTTPLVAGAYTFDTVVATNWGKLDISSAATVSADLFDMLDDGRIIVGGGGDIIAPQVTVSANGMFLLNKSLTLPTIHVFTDGVLSHSAGEAGFDLTITGDLTVDAGGSISADGKGSGSSAGPGQGGDNYSYGAGAGYGGAGGDSYNDSAAGGSAYGSITQPVDLGSGGGHATGYALGGAGGGAIRLTVDGTFTLEGALSANGATGQGTSSPGGGGGSGGSIYLTVSTLSGAGSIAANGGNSGGSYNYGGGGGGGRVAIYYDADTFTGSAAVCGGSGYLRGGAGTIYTKSSTQTYGDLLVDNCGNNGVTTPLVAGAYTFDTVVATNWGKLDISSAATVSADLFDMLDDGRIIVGGGGDIIAPQVTVSANGMFLLNKSLTLPTIHVFTDGVLSHSAGEAGFDLTITGDLTVDAGGSISADGKGSGSSAGPGQGGDNYSYGAGAGYGGAGGDSYNDSAAGGSAYGSITQPVDLGSGGGHATGYALGGAGGGAIRLTVDGTFTLEGALSANGATGQGTSSPGGGGGSGGSIYLTVSTLSGAGSIAANGGNSGGSYNYGGGGGGGRVAIYYVDILGFDVGSISASGGSGYEDGEPGSLWVLYGIPHVLFHSPTTVNYTPIDFIEVAFSEALAPPAFGAEDVVITGPGGLVAADPPTDQGEGVWRINFPPQSANGTYHIYIGPHIEDLNGNEMDQNMNQVLGEEPLPPGGPPYTDLGDVYEAIFTIRPPALYVDDDAVSDPGPGDPGISDPDEDGTPDHPYDSIQEAIDVALEFDDVIVLPGTYFENISFEGKGIRLTSSDPNDQAVVTATVIDGTHNGPVVSFAQGEDDQSTLVGVKLIGGSAVNGGGIYISGASPTVTKNIIEANGATITGAAIYCSNSQALISDNRISSNFGAGIACSGASATPTIEHNIITDNWLRGVHCLSSAAPLVRNNIIAWNFGEGIKCESSAAPQVVNCTITNNDLTGVLSSSASPMITSCILWDNTNDLSGCSATYSIVQDGDNGQGNTPFAPHFVNPLIDDFHLRSWSPGIDAGDPNYVADPNETDIDGDDRILLAQVDMGADESGVMSPDTDGDGLPDDWEEYHWPGDLSQGPADDPDVDGISNLGEYLFDRDPTVIDSDPLAIRLVEWSAGSIDSSAAETVGISYLLDRHAYVTVNLHNGDTNVLVRTVVDGEFQPAGFNAVIWDGHGDPNDPLAADSPALPQGAYYFEIFADDPLSAGSDPPHHGEWLKRSNTSPAYTGTTTVSGDFNPFLNDLVEIRTTLTQTGIAPLTIRDTGSGNATIRNLRPVLDGGVLETIFWDGRYNDGTIFTGSYEVYFAVPRGVPGNSIIVRNQALQITNLVCEAYMILPSYGEVSTIKYTLPVNADVSIDMTDPDGDHFRTLLTDQPQAAGPQQIIWDGRNDTDQMIAKEGDYTVVITAVDPVTGTTTTRYGVVVAYR